MAIYHLTIKTIGRSTGRSSVGAAAYRAGEKITNSYDGITHDYTRKGGIAFTEILLPENAPDSFADRSILWNAVEQSEKRKDAQTAREIEIALPAELGHQAQIDLLRSYVSSSFVSLGMCADMTIHDKNDGNPHAHIMLTTRSVSTAGFGQKNRDWNKRENAELWRANWANTCNDFFFDNRIPERLDHRSFERRGLKLLPTVHLGKEAFQMEQRGIKTERGLYNDEVREINAKHLSITKEQQTLQAEHDKLIAGLPSLDQAAADHAAQKNFLAYEFSRISKLIRAAEVNKVKYQTSLAKVTETMDDIQELIRTRSSYRRQHSELTGYLSSLGLFAFREKRETNDRIENLNRLISKTEKTLLNTHGTTPKKAAERLSELEFEKTATREKIKALDINGLYRERDEVEQMYRTELKRGQIQTKQPGVVDSIGKGRTGQKTSLILRLEKAKKEAQQREEHKKRYQEKQAEEPKRRKGWSMEL